MVSSRSRYDKDAKIAPSENMKKKRKEVPVEMFSVARATIKDWPQLLKLLTVMWK